MAVQVVEPQWPNYGVVRRLGHFGNFALSEKPFTPWCVNVRPDDPFVHRFRGGSRLGLTDISPADMMAMEADGVLMLEGGDYLLHEGASEDIPSGQVLTEDGTPIWTEDGEEIVADNVAATESLSASVAESIRAFGVDSITAVASDGTAPTDYTLGCVYRDRLVLGGADHIVYMSRQGDWTDWDYGADVEDAQRAFLFQCSEAAEIGDTVTAIVPHRDMAMFASTKKGLWVMNGDPVDGGSLRWVSRDVGILTNTAWCKAGDTLYFLSHDGLYSVNADGSGLKCLSGDSLPSELVDINTDTVSVFLGHNHDDDGVYIFLVGDDYHWFFDFNFNGFWPFTLPAANDPEAVFTHNGQMVLYDGTSSYWTTGGDDDDGTDIESHVVLGPFRFGSGVEFGILSAIHAAIDTDTGGSVTWNIITGDSAQDVCADAKSAIEAYMDDDTTTASGYVSASGTWSDGRSFFSHPRVRGMWMAVWLYSTDKWAFEAMSLEAANAGGWR